MEEHIKKFAALFFALTSFIILQAPLPVQAADAVKFTYSIFFPPAHGQAEAGMAWAREIEKRTDGRVRIDVFAGGTLTPAPEVYDGVVNGISDIGMSCFAYT
ncbi:MAG TPA: C4-dicarboxylate ABC transporter substrate-binding protein, partial [Spirochaetes bacterium]|nr:C4-dicarboxylate ABC transporter substrate-binding protein [Spirochaetota bacterium]